MHPDPLTLICITRNRGTGSNVRTGGSWLAATLASLAATCARPHRLILVDDGSTDDTEALLRKVVMAHPDWDIPLRFSEESKGLAAWENQLLAEMETPYFVRFDDDILFERWGDHGLEPNVGWDDRLANYWRMIEHGEDGDLGRIAMLGGLQLDGGGPGIQPGAVHSFGDKIIDQPAIKAGSLYGGYYRHRYACMVPWLDDLRFRPQGCNGLQLVQSVMGAFCSYRTDAIRAIGGWDPIFNRLRPEHEDLSLAAMLGYHPDGPGDIREVERTWISAVAPGLDVVHYQNPANFDPERFRAESWNTTDGIGAADEAWLRKWGFDRAGLSMVTGQPHVGLVQARAESFKRHWAGTALWDHFQGDTDCDLNCVGPSEQGASAAVSFAGATDAELIQELKRRETEFLELMDEAAKLDPDCGSAV